MLEANIDFNLSNHLSFLSWSLTDLSFNTCKVIKTVIVQTGIQKYLFCYLSLFFFKYLVVKTLNMLNGCQLWLGYDAEIPTGIVQVSRKYRMAQALVDREILPVWLPPHNPCERSGRPSKFTTGKQDSRISPHPSLIFLVLTTMPSDSTICSWWLRSWLVNWGSFNALTVTLINLKITVLNTMCQQYFYNSTT